MRIAEICPVCATYINASCILYDGEYLSNIDVSPLDPLDEILGKINDAFAALEGAGEPSEIPMFIGQLYVDTDNYNLYIGLGTDSVNWGLIGPITTTTTTTTTP